MKPLSRFVPLVLLVAVMALGCLMSVAAADPDHDAAAVTQPADTPAAAPAATPAPSSSGPAATPAAEPGSNSDLLARLHDAEARYAELKHDMTTPKKFLWAGMIAATANLLLSGVKRVAKLTDAGKRYLPWASVGLGAVVTVCLHYVGGASMFDSMLYGGSAPFAVVIQELVGPIRSKSAPA